MTILQEANARYVDAPSAPRRDWRDLGTGGKDRPDMLVVLERFFINASGEQEWLDLSTCWLPFVQTGPQQRRFWSKKRLAKAIDLLVEQGFIKDVDGSDCRWELTDMGLKWGRS